MVTLHVMKDVPRFGVVNGYPLTSKGLERYDAALFANEAGLFGVLQPAASATYYAHRGWIFVETSYHHDLS